MMLACNMFLNIICGYASYYMWLCIDTNWSISFWKINNRNVLSIPLGLNFGWAGELNLQYTLEKLFEEPFGTSYPKKEGKRKQKKTEQLFAIKHASQKNLIDIIIELDSQILKPAFSRKTFYDYFVIF